MENTKDARNRQGSEGIIDLRQELIELYAGEQMLVFFEFTLEHPENEALSGLCRIAQPKPHRSTLRYLSLIFLVDTHDSANRPVVRKALARLEGSALKTAARYDRQRYHLKPAFQHRELYRSDGPAAGGCGEQGVHHGPTHSCHRPHCPTPSDPRRVVGGEPAAWLLLQQTHYPAPSSLLATVRDRFRRGTERG
ncbi:MAG: hypothetical protein GKR94_25000 [Gammaproteobacteria bacterium]|nr:hypothetical protein [Gammaproteobacteria bacterium]